MVNDSDEKLTATTVEPDDEESEVDVFRASFSQQRLWFLNQLEPASSFYNIPLMARIKGVLNADVLGRAVNAIVDRHESLRTTFATQDGQLLQSIAPKTELTLQLIDLTEMPDDEREKVAAALVKAEAEALFDLAQGPLLRVGLLKLRQDEQLLMVTMHHICSDGWSIRVFLDELTTLYQAFLLGQPSPFPDLTIQYADCAEWQRELVQGEFLEKHLAYWRKQLAGAPAVLELPTDRPRSRVQTFRGDRRTLELSRELRDQLSELSQREGVTLFMTLLAAFQTLLYRYSGLDDIVVGSPSANRNRPEIEKLIGVFVNTLVLRTDFSGNPGFRELLKRVREVAVGAYTHQDVPFDRLVDDLNPERSLSHSPLIQVIFSLGKSSDLSAQLAGVEISWLEIDRGTSKFDLALFVTEEPAGLSCMLEYDTDLFSAETIGRMLDHFQVVLEGIVRNPDQRVAELPLLTGPELVRLTDGASVTSRVPLPTTCLHQTFELQAERTPENVALTFENEQLTYRELNARANQLAHHLRKQGVGPDVLVGLCLERSVEMIVGILGIVKAGGAYLALDLAYPTERLSFMLNDAEVKVLVTSEDLAEKVTPNQAAVLLIDRAWKTIAHESKENTKNNCVAENLAYVIYTSGSTGKPKGVPVTHQNVTRLFEITDSSFGFNQDDVWTLFHSTAFDFSVWEIWGALLYGGRLVVVPYWISRAPKDFLDLIRREKVTVLNQTPSAFRQLVPVATAGSKEKLALRFIIFGGEALELQSLKPWFDLYGDRSPRLVNMYGITETTVHVTHRPLDTTDLEETAGSVIGHPLGDLRVYLLDQLQQFVPVGVPGEMYVGGAGLSRGYLKRSDLTGERFVPDAFSSIPGARLFRTGDLARYLQNGDLQYLGRLDRQVKVRGFRIELGEIEAVLAQHENVRECVVIAQENQGDGNNLIAYLVAVHSARNPGVLRAFLRQKLPEYMVPSEMVYLDQLPLTSSGKIDRSALPRPTSTTTHARRRFAAPRTPTEEALAGIWHAVLRRDHVGSDDNFFDLGGNSLLATQVISRVRDIFGLEIPVRSLFDYPRLAEFGALIDRTVPAENANQSRVMTPLARKATRVFSSSDESVPLAEDVTGRK